MPAVLHAAAPFVALQDEEGAALVERMARVPRVLLPLLLLPSLRQHLAEQPLQVPHPHGRPRAGGGRLGGRVQVHLHNLEVGLG